MLTKTDVRITLAKLTQLQKNIEKNIERIEGHSLKLSPNMKSRAALIAKHTRTLKQVNAIIKYIDTTYNRFNKT